jgi:hypothetical protein
MGPGSASTFPSWTLLTHRRWACILLRTLTVALRRPLNERRSVSFLIDRPFGSSLCRIPLKLFPAMCWEDMWWSGSIANTQS